MHDIDITEQIEWVEYVAGVLERGDFCCDPDKEHWHRYVKAKHLRAAAETLKDVWRRMEAEYGEKHQ